jgi:hypothetical protein
MISWRLPLSCSSRSSGTGRKGGSFDSRLFVIRLRSSQSLTAAMILDGLDPFGQNHQV